MKGIHGNEECVRCGACCIYFAIMEDRARFAEYKPIFKLDEYACEFLSYDFKTKIATCIAHDGERPRVCVETSCSRGWEEHFDGLRKVLANMDRYFEKAEPNQQLFKPQ